VREVFDTTGRFRRRPHFDQIELDRICEDTVRGFLIGRYREVRYPLLTDDLTVLLEQRANTLDLYADLTGEGEQVEGATYFRRGAKPDVAIAAHLSQQKYRENRFRTTLSHELGHVVLHGHLWALEAETLPLFGHATSTEPARCLRGNLYGSGRVDWMEWQAGYACAAFLMPASELALIVQHGAVPGLPQPDSERGQQMILTTQQAFAVSAEAARIRLLQTGHLARQATLAST
jgi:Zn-dependent peptidase ImmA (M78 family)